MNRSSLQRGFVLGALVVCAAFGVASRSAQAATRFDIGVGVGGGGGYGYGYAPVYSAPVYAAPVYVTPACTGHYESHIERVLVAPERRDRRWSEAVYETRYINGYSQNVLVGQPGWREIYVPAQYENRTVQVWVPGCVTYAPRYVAPSFGFDFTYRNRH